MRLEQLTFTRFLAAISIVIFHYGKYIFPFNLEAVSFLFRQANIGVSYFFILSGFVMVIAYANKEKVDFVDYLKRRFARIYPVYGLAIIIMLAYFLIIGKHIYYKELLFNLLMIQSWIPGYALSFNGPGWSLSIEMFFYVTFPFLFNHLYKKFSLKKLIFPFLLFFIGSQVLLHVLLNSSFYKGFPSESHDFIYYFPLMHFSEFLIGNLAGIFFIKGIKVKNYDLHIIVLIIIVLILFKFNIGLSYHNGLLAFIFVPILLLVSSNLGLLTKISNMKLPVFLGEISYSIYILQKPIFIWVNKIMNYLNLNNKTIIFYSALLILIIISGISYKYFETPIRKLINKKRITKYSSIKHN